VKSKSTHADFIKGWLGRAAPSAHEDSPLTQPPAAVAIIGMDGRFPGCESIEAFWQAIAGRKVLYGPHSADYLQTRTHCAAPATIVAGLIDSALDFDPRFFKISGSEAHFTSPRDALAAGVGMVHQELAFCDNLSVAENLTLSDLPARGGMVDREAMRQRAETMLAETGTELDVTREFGKLAIGQRQMVQIAAAVGGGARIIVFDEPTSSLSQAEAERLFALIERLKARGVTCIYVSHRMPEIFRLCDAVTVLRDGRHVATRATASLTESDLVQMMIGRPLAEYFGRHSTSGIGDVDYRVVVVTVLVVVIVSSQQMLGRSALMVDSSGSSAKEMKVNP